MTPYDFLSEIIHVELAKSSVLSSIAVRSPPGLFPTKRAEEGGSEHPFCAPLPVLGRFETLLRGWLDRGCASLDRELPASLWNTIASAFCHATGRTDFVRFVVGVLSRSGLTEENRRRIATFCGLVTERVLDTSILWVNGTYPWAIDTSIDPLEMWRSMIGPLDIPELWELFMLPYMLEEERTGCLSFHLTVEDALTASSMERPPTPFLSATRCFRDTYRALEPRIRRPVSVADPSFDHYIAT